MHCPANRDYQEQAPNAGTRAGSLRCTGRLSVRRQVPQTRNNDS